MLQVLDVESRKGFCRYKHRVRLLTHSKALDLVELLGVCCQNAYCICSGLKSTGAAEKGLRPTWRQLVLTFSFLQRPPRAPSPPRVALQFQPTCILSIRRGILAHNGHSSTESLYRTLAGRFLVSYMRRIPPVKRSSIGEFFIIPTVGSPSPFGILRKDG